MGVYFCISYSQKSEWTELRKAIDCAQRRTNDESVAIREYQLHILRDAIVPYVKSFSSRLKVDRRRPAQVCTLLQLLTIDTDTVAHDAAGVSYIHIHIHILHFIWLFRRWHIYRRYNHCMSSSSSGSVADRAHRDDHSLSEWMVDE